METAPYLPRLIAFMIDSVIALLVAAPIFIVMSLVGLHGAHLRVGQQLTPAQQTTFLVTIVFAMICAIMFTFVYYGLTMTRGGERNGQTWGKQIMHLRTIKADRSVVGWRWTFLREIVLKIFLFGWIASMVLFLPLLADGLWPVWDAHAQALHDKIVKSYVVDDRLPPEK